MVTEVPDGVWRSSGSRVSPLGFARFGGCLDRPGSGGGRELLGGGLSLLSSHGRERFVLRDGVEPTDDVLAFGLGAHELHPGEGNRVLGDLLGDMQPAAHHPHQGFVVLAVEDLLVASLR